MADGQKVIRFVVQGTVIEAFAGARSGGKDLADAPELGTVKQAVRVASQAAAQRGGSPAVTLDATLGEDIVELQVVNGPTLYLHPESAYLLMRAQDGVALDDDEHANTGAPPEVRVPAQLSWRVLDGSPEAESTRGLLMGIGRIALAVVRIIRRKLGDQVAKLSAEALARRIDDQVNPGVYRLRADVLEPLKEKGSELRVAGTIEVPKPSADGTEQASLVLIHGTFSNTEGTFGKLWKHHHSRVQQLFAHYGNRVYALEHETLGTSPFGNALALLHQVPDGAVLDLLTHSRGGLVAEVVSRIVNGQGLDAMALFDAEPYAQYRKDLAQLTRHAKRGIRIRRLVRVACPARGTLLASKRLDAYLSVFKWTLELAGLKVLPALLVFIGEVARHRHAPDVLPGLESMVPETPFLKWLLRPVDPIAGDLRVIAGDIRGDSVLSWVKTLVTDAFYWTDHDLVVQTRSMYGGTPRGEGSAKFVLDRRGKVSHFRYFEHLRTASAIVNSLLGTDKVEVEVGEEQPEPYRVIGPLSWAGDDVSGVRGAAARRRKRDASRPAVFVLPGIAGSHLKVDGYRVWLGWRFFNNVDTLEYPSPSDVTPDGAVGRSYSALMDHLARTHEVHEFSYDWRLPIEEEGRRLADVVDDAVRARKQSDQPVRILAHSVGGLVVRAMQLERPKTWAALMAHAEARVLMLGTPNGGSYAPMQVLSGDDTFGNLLSTVGSLFDGYKARRVMASMPGFLQLQANLIDSPHMLDRVQGWRGLAEADLKVLSERVGKRSWWHNDKLQQQTLEWGVPSTAALKKAVALRQALDKQRTALPNADRVLLVLGSARWTPVAVRRSDRGVEYLNASDGDGRVTADNARLPGVLAWKADVEHGGLASASRCFEAYVELLDKGTTRRLPRADSTSRASTGEADQPNAEMAVWRAARQRGTVEPPNAVEQALLAPELLPVATAQPHPTRLHLRFVNGDLRYVGAPLLIGHYRSGRLSGAERVIDRLLGGQMAQALHAEVYPSEIGRQQIFTNTLRHPDEPFRMPRPAAVIVVGLAEEGDLGMTALIESVREGVLAYAQRVGERPDADTSFELATTLIGSGSSSMPISTCAQAVAIGVQQANLRLSAVGWPTVRQLSFIELYLDRAAEALQGVLALSDMLAQDLVVEQRIHTAKGALRRPPEISYRGAEYDFIAVSQEGPDSPLRFTLDTRRARSEVRGVSPQRTLVRELVSEGASDSDHDRQIGRTLFQLLVPMEVEPFLADSAAVLLQLDHYSAQYPWELLDATLDGRSGDSDGRPWALRTKLLRKLRTDDDRQQVRYAGGRGGVLVVGEPRCDPKKYGPLPAAQREAKAVAAELGAKLVLQANAARVVKEALADSYRVIHIAGHGDFRESTRNGQSVQVGGIVLSHGGLFGPDEVLAMRQVPDLAFINCCHVGRLEDETLTERSGIGANRPVFAASVAEALIKVGVRCVVAAGWAVDDELAAEFARHFYRALKDGKTFRDAVAQAREHVWILNPASNTWAAYQCYGDPDWRLTDGSGELPGHQDTPMLASAEGLLLRLQGHHLELQQEEIKSHALTQVRQLDARYGGVWGGMGAVATAFGRAYGEADEFEIAASWYERASKAEDGGGSVLALQQLGNLKVRFGTKAGDLAEGRKLIDEGLTTLQSVMQLAPSMECASLLGSAYKRLAILEEKAASASSSGQRAKGGKAAAKAKEVAKNGGAVSPETKVVAALRKSREYYDRAVQIAVKIEADNLYYPLLNRIAIDTRLGHVVKAADLRAVRASLAAKVAADPDFWSVIGQTELVIYEATAKRSLAAFRGRLLAEIADLRARPSSHRAWGSVRVQAEFVLGPYMACRDHQDREWQAARDILNALAD